VAHKATCARCGWELLLPSDESAQQALVHHFKDKHAPEEKGERKPSRAMALPGGKRMNGRGVLQ
jgi:hypothetical protein